MIKKNKKVILVLIIIGVIIMMQGKKEAQYSVSLQYLIDRCESTENIYDCTDFYCRDTASGTCASAYTQCVGAPVVHSCSGVSVCNEYAYGCNLGWIKLIECGVEKGKFADCPSGTTCEGFFIESSPQTVSYVQGELCISSPGTCTDTDGGIVINVKGTVTDNDGQVRTDFCQDSNTVQEYFCDTDNLFTATLRDCGSGEQCLDGACSGINQCIDSGGAPRPIGYKYCRWTYPQTEYSYECLADSSWDSTSCPALCNDAIGECYVGECVPDTFRNEICQDENTLKYDKCGTDRYWDNNIEIECGTGTICESGQCKSVDCTDTTWTPAIDTVCLGTTFTQTSNCDNTRSVTGTKDCNGDDEEPPEIDACGNECLSGIQTCDKATGKCKTSSFIWILGIFLVFMVAMGTMGKKK